MKLQLGDCVEALPTLKDASVDLLVTDPPYGISFMGKSWDQAVPSVEAWKQCLRVLKPGSLAFVMSLPRLDTLSQMAPEGSEAEERTA
jgi:DNA modification methylase